VIVYNNLANIFRGCPIFLFSIKCEQRYWWQFQSDPFDCD